MRLSALNRLTEENIPTVVRIDPIIPTLNSDRQDLENIVSKAAEAGVKQVTASTLKPIRGFFQSLRKAHPALFETLKRAYADGEWLSGYKYLERKRRLGILEQVRSISLSYGLEFATCREGFPELNTTICDGTAYCRRRLIENHLG